MAERWEMDPIYRESLRVEGRARRYYEVCDHIAATQDKSNAPTHQGRERSTLGWQDDRKYRQNGSCSSSSKDLNESQLIWERSHSGGNSTRIWEKPKTISTPQETPEEK